jgi:hypothetical protein
MQHFVPRSVSTGKTQATAQSANGSKEYYCMRKFAALVLVLVPLALAGCSHPQPVAYAPPPPPPGVYSAVAQQGYHDGVDAARRDIRSGLSPDVRRHPRFRNPPVDPPLREDFRHGFRDGYNAVIQGGAPPRPGY